MKEKLVHELAGVMPMLNVGYGTIPAPTFEHRRLDVTNRSQVASSINGQIDLKASMGIAGITKNEAAGEPEKGLSLTILGSSKLHDATP